MQNISFSYENPILKLLGPEFFADVPTQAGVYFFIDENRSPLYIGKADSLRKRLANYKNAKPGSVPDHILEMLEHARTIRWETHSTGKVAYAREQDLIRTIGPRFNIAGNSPLSPLYCGVRARRVTRSKLTKVDFRLSHTPLEDGFESYGCYLNRGKVKAGYSALLRLIYAATCERERFLIPAKLCRTSPAYVHEAVTPTEWVKPLSLFLAGRKQNFLSLLTHQLLSKDNIQPHLYAPLQRDLACAQTFFDAGPSMSRKLARKAGLSSSRELTSDHVETVLEMRRIDLMAELDLR